MITTLSRFLVLTFCCCVILHTSYAQDSSAVVQQVGFISVTATISWIDNSQQDLLDSISWIQQPSLAQRYGGRRIKKVLLQKTTNRVVVFVAGEKVAWMSKDSAVSAGLIAADKTKEKQVSKYRGRTLDYYIKTPVFVGQENLVTVGNRNTIPAPGTNSRFYKRSAEDEYMVTAHNPGPMAILLKDTVTDDYFIYHLVAKRLETDRPGIEPVVQLGDISTQTATPDELKLQKEMFVSNGYTLVGADIYFSGTGFRDVVLVKLYDRLGVAKSFMNVCIPGSTIVFDNIQVKDSSNNLYDMPDVVVNVVDPSYTDDPAINYGDSSSPAGFPGGEQKLQAYVLKKLHFSPTDEVAKGNIFIGILLKIGADGSVQAATDDELPNMTRLERKCYDIISKGPRWEPAKYKGKPIETILSFSTNLNADL